jgi:hypothetical protein
MIHNQRDTSSRILHLDQHLCFIYSAFCREVSTGLCTHWECVGEPYCWRLLENAQMQGIRLFSSRQAQLLRNEDNGSAVFDPELHSACLRHELRPNVAHVEGRPNVAQGRRQPSRYPHSSSLRRTAKYASFLRSWFSNSLLAGRFHELRWPQPQGASRISAFFSQTLGVPRHSRGVTGDYYGMNNE